MKESLDTLKHSYLVDENKSIIKSWKEILNVLNVIFADNRDSKQSTMTENL
jgi:predicted acetyltransferase